MSYKSGQTAFLRLCLPAVNHLALAGTCYIVRIPLPFSACFHIINN